MQTTIRGQVLQTTHTQDDVLDRLIRQKETAKRVSFCAALSFADPTERHSPHDSLISLGS